MIWRNGWGIALDRISPAEEGKLKPLFGREQKAASEASREARVPAQGRGGHPGGGHLCCHPCTPPALRGPLERPWAELAALAMGHSAWWHLGAGHGHQQRRAGGAAGARQARRWGQSVSPQRGGTGWAGGNRPGMAETWQRACSWGGASLTPATRHRLEVARTVLASQR